MGCYSGKQPTRRRRRTTSIYEKIVLFRKWAAKKKEASAISLSGQILHKNTTDKKTSQ